MVLFDDDRILVVNKPAGLVCHPTKDGEYSSLVGRIRLHLGNTSGRLVNRLDRETSGLVLIAKSAEVAAELGKLFGTPAVQNTYLAVVHGHVEASDRTIDAPLGRDEHSRVAIKNCVRDDGASARTTVRVLRVFERGGRPYSALEIRPMTGRKHQIRIHLAHIGHAVVGDKIYGDDEERYLRFVTGALTPADTASLFLTNHALHAASLAFEWRGRHWTFSAAPGPELQAWLHPEEATMTLC